MTMWRWSILLIVGLLLVGCATTPVVPATTPPPDEPDEQATPEPPAVVAEDQHEDELAGLLDGEMSKDGTPEPAKPKPSEITERDLPLDNEAAPPPPADVPAPRETLPPQKELARADQGRLDAALTGGADARRQASLALSREGRALMDEGNPYLAEKRFERALSVDSGCGQAYLGLAELRFAQEEWAQAADLATKAALRLAPDAYFLSRAHLLAAKALVNTERLRAALHQTEQALEADPSNGEARALQFRLRQALGMPTDE